MVLAMISEQKKSKNDKMLNLNRLDIWLWHSRFSRTRVNSQKICKKGQIRVNGKRVMKAHKLIKKGDIVTLPLGSEIVVLRIISIPEKRLCASSAIKPYELITE